MNATTIQLLLVEDSPSDALIVQDELAHVGGSVSIVHVEHLSEALERLKAQSFDVVLLDLSLPDSQGFETFARLHDAAPGVPIVVLSGRADEGLAIKAVQAGAQDYLVKGRMAEGVMPRAIRYAIERQRSERTLAESEERYRLLIEGSPDGYLVHCDGKIVFANAASLKLFGADGQEQLLGRSFMDSVTPEFRDIISQRSQNALAQVSNPPLEVMGLRLDGTTVDMEATSKAFVHGGRPAVQVVLRDITVRKRAEERIREQASMLDHAHDAIIVRGFHDRKVTFWSKGAEALYGWTVGEALGREIGELIHIEPAESEESRNALLKTDEWRAEICQTSKDGRKLIVNTSATLVRDAAGEPKSVLSINIDITEQKNLEARFLRAQRMESIGTLASGVAHDLNNILAPIMMSVPVLRRELSAEQRDEIIETIEMSAERGAQIIKQVLTFGRGLEGEKCPLQADALIREMMKIMRGTFPKNVALECSVESELWAVIGDATQLHQVLLNLCVNARDAMPEGGSLRITAHNIDLDASYASMLPEATAGPYVLIEVIDTGTGIPPEIVERIFDPFFTTKVFGKGTGLGLSTTIGIVKGHGGFIQVHSKSKTGTTFQVYLPAAPEQEAVPTGPAREVVPGGHGELVLIVDDEENIRNAARMILEAFGYQTLLAADGTEAMAVYVVHSGRIAAVLTDLMMPHMDGPALIRALRSLRPTLPIIASTGLGDKVHLADLKAMNVETILHKPYGANTLLRAIRETLHPGADSKAK